MKEKTTTRVEVYGGMHVDFIGFYTPIKSEEFGKSGSKFVQGTLQDFYNKPGNIELYFESYSVFHRLYGDDIRVLNCILDKDTVCGVDCRFYKIEKEIVSIKIGDQEISKYVLKRILAYCILRDDMERLYFEKYKSLFDIEKLIEFFSSDEAMTKYIKDKKNYSRNDFKEE